MWPVFQQGFCSSSSQIQRWPSLLLCPLNSITQEVQPTDEPVSVFAGEYAMLKAAAQRGWLNEKDAVLEALLCLRRAGSDIILTYYATQAAKWMAGE